MGGVRGHLSQSRLPGGKSAPEQDDAHTHRRGEVPQVEQGGGRQASEADEELEEEEEARLRLQFEGPIEGWKDH